MEYLVTMTTHVPDRTPQEAIQEVRTREAARSRELAAQGHLLRLWRPPLQPGEWRTLGLFAAADGGRLEKLLASMPLRVWRTDEVTPLSPHPNDPPLAPAAGQDAAEFLVTFTVTVPPGTSDRMVRDVTAREEKAAQHLAAQGHLLRLWTLPDGGRALGLYRARDSAQLEAILAALPLAPWLTVHTTPLSPHPSDPAGNSRTTPGRRSVLGGLAALPVLYGVASAVPARVTSAARPGSAPTAADDLIRGVERRYNAPLLTPGTRLVLPSGVKATPVLDYYHHPRRAPAASAWPHLKAADGTTVDASVIPERGAPTRIAVVDGFTEGWYEVIHAGGRADRVTWDAGQLPVLWVYGEFGATTEHPYRDRFYALALQPMSRNPYAAIF